MIASHHVRFALRSAALRLACDIGIPVLPCNDKTPLLSALKADGTRWDKDIDCPSLRVVAGGFHRATTCPEAIAEWWTQWPTANVAGRLDGALRLCLLDCDSAEAAPFLRECTQTPTWSWFASRGINRLYRAPDELRALSSHNLWTDRFGKGVEFKSLGAVTLPPSVKDTGHQYAWVDGMAPWECDLAELPQVVADEVRRVIAARAQLIEARDARAALDRHHLPAVRRDESMSRDRKALRVQRYLEAVPVGLSDGRKQAAYKLAAALTTRLECEPAEVHSIVEAWNACNAPPLRQRELHDIVNNACRYAPRNVA